MAIASYSGYNQEDAVILNKSSVQRGMFQSVFPQLPRREEIKANSTSYFANPKYQPNVQRKNLSSFDKLDDNGFILVGEKITSDDMITGKCVRDGDVTHVSGSTIKFGTYGTVDKVIIYENKDQI